MDDSDYVTEEKAEASDDHQDASSESEGESDQQQKESEQEASSESEEDSKPKHNVGHWTDEEHEKFLEGMRMFGWKNYKRISEYVGTRDASQVRSHLQKYKQKKEKEQENAVAKRNIDEKSRAESSKKKVRRTIMTGPSLKKFVTKKPSISAHQHMQFSEEDDHYDTKQGEDSAHKEKAKTMSNLLAKAAASSSVPKAEKLTTAIYARQAPAAKSSNDDTPPEKYEYHDYAQDLPPTFSEIPMSKNDMTFPTRLYRLLERADTEGYTSIISWQSHGRAFTVHDEGRCVELLSKEGLAQSWKSFLRSLRKYGFRKITGAGDDMGCFFHEKFLRGRDFLVLTLLPSGRDPKGTACIPDFSTLPAVEPLKPSSNVSTPKDSASTEQQLVLHQLQLREQQRMQQQHQIHQHLDHAKQSPWLDPAVIGLLVQANINSSAPMQNAISPKGMNDRGVPPGTKEKESESTSKEPEVVVLDDSDSDGEEQSDQSTSSYKDEEEEPLPSTERSIITRLLFSLGSANEKNVQGSLKRLTSMSIFDTSNPAIGRSLINKGCVQAILRALKNFPHNQGIAFFCLDFFAKLVDLQIFKFVIILTALDGGIDIMHCVKRHPKHRSIIIRSFDLLTYLIGSSVDAAGRIACTECIDIVVETMDAYEGDGLVQEKGCLLLGKIGKSRPNYAKRIVPVQTRIYENFSDGIAETARRALLEVLNASDPKSDESKSLAEQSSHKKSLRFLFFDLASTDAIEVEEAITALRRVLMVGATAEDLAVERSSSAQFILLSLLNHTDTKLSIRSILLMLLDVITLDKDASFYRDVVDIDIARVVLDQIEKYRNDDHQEEGEKQINLIQTFSIGVLLNLAQSSEQAAASIVREGGIDAVVESMNRFPKDGELLNRACLLFFHLSEKNGFWAHELSAKGGLSVISEVLQAAHSKQLGDSEDVADNAKKAFDLIYLKISS